MTCGGGSGADIQKLLNKDRAKVLDFLNLIAVVRPLPTFRQKTIKTGRSSSGRERELTGTDERDHTTDNTVYES